MASESEDEYWERHPDDEVKVVDEGAIVVGAEETIGEKKAYIEKLKALSSDEKTTAKSFADTILALKSLCHLDDVALDTGAVIELWYTSDVRAHATKEPAGARE